MRPLIAGNWKMHGLSRQLEEIEAIAACAVSTSGVAEVLLCLPATLISRATQAAAGRIGIGGEDCHAQVAGAFTGDVSAEMLKDAGATTVIVGHSERRRYHQETNEVVAAKTSAAWRSQLAAIICVGETHAQRRAGDALSVCGHQIARSIPGDEVEAAATAVAYEPLWAIGNGQVPSPEQISEVHAHIRGCLAARFGPEHRAIRILYGGSVTCDNVADILGLPEVGGVLIGGASLRAADFNAVLRAVPGKTSLPNLSGHALAIKGDRRSRPPSRLAGVRSEEKRIRTRPSRQHPVASDLRRARTVSRDQVEVWVNEGGAGGEPLP